jgi:hypothetical protein
MEAPMGVAVSCCSSVSKKKDAITGHNPIAVLYGQNFYYKRLQKQKLEL